MYLFAVEHCRHRRQPLRVDLPLAELQQVLQPDNHSLNDCVSRLWIISFLIDLPNIVGWGVHSFDWKVGTWLIFNKLTYKSWSHLFLKDIYLFLSYQTMTS